MTSRLLLPDPQQGFLRPLRVDDASGWSAYLAKPGVTEHTSWGDITPQALAILIAQYESGQDALRWAIVDQRDVLLGTVGLNEISRVHGRAELAYDLDPLHGGRGLATTAAHAVVKLATETLELQRVHATVLDSNRPSIAVLERIGMQREGLMRGYRKVRGQPRNYWMYATVVA